MLCQPTTTTERLMIKKARGGGSKLVSFWTWRICGHALVVPFVDVKYQKHKILDLSQRGRESKIEQTVRVGIESEKRVTNTWPLKWNQQKVIGWKEGGLVNGLYYKRDFTWVPRKRSWWGFDRVQSPNGCCKLTGSQFWLFIDKRSTLIGALAQQGRHTNSEAIHTWL